MCCLSEGLVCVHVGKIYGVHAASELGSMKELDRDKHKPKKALFKRVVQQLSSLLHIQKIMGLERSLRVMLQSYMRYKVEGSLWPLINLKLYGSVVLFCILYSRLHCCVLIVATRKKKQLLNFLLLFLCRYNLAVC